MMFSEHNSSYVSFVLKPPKNLKNDVLQHLFVNSCLFVKIPLLLPYLKISHLRNCLKFSSKKVVIMFGQFVESIYLCIRNRKGHPLRLYEERVL